MTITCRRSVSNRGGILKLLVILLAIGAVVFIVIQLQNQLAKPVPIQPDAEISAPGPGTASHTVSAKPMPAARAPAGPKSIFSDMTPGPAAVADKTPQKSTMKGEDPALVAAEAHALAQSPAYTAQAAEVARLKAIWDVTEKSGSIQERLDAGAACNQAREKLRHLETQIFAADPAVAAAKNAAGGH